VKMKKLLLIITILFGSLLLFSQGNSIYTNDYTTPFITNPACTGAEYYPVAKLSVRKQWLGFYGSPTTYLLAGSSRIGNFDFYNPKGLVNTGPVQSKNRIGLGAAVFQDNNGPLINNGGILSYAYHLPVNRKSKLSFGMSMILMNHSIKTSILDPHDPNDDYLFDKNNEGFRLNFGFGAYYYSSKYFVGLAANKVLRDMAGVNEEKRNVANYFFMDGYKLSLEDYQLEPSVSVKRIDNKQFIMDIHAKFYFQNVNWVAISYSSIQQVDLEFAINLYRTVYAGYHYAYSISEVSSNNFGSHEIALGINLGLVSVEGIRKLVD